MKNTFFVIYLLFVFYSYSNYAQSIRINELGIINTQTIQDEYGEFDDWIELYNASDNSINLNGYFITDNIEYPPKHQFKCSNDDLTLDPDEFIILFADGDTSQGITHLNFKLNDDEIVVLYSSSFQIIDSISLIIQRPDVSYGRDMESTASWVYYAEPTPEGANTSTGYYGITPSPVFNIKGGIYNQSLDLTIPPFDIYSSVYYTVDNSTPDANSPSFPSSLSIDSTTIVRAIAERENYLPSDIVSHAYIINESFSLPVFVVITDKQHLWGDSGIYSNPWEEGIEWEKPCQIQYIKDNKTETTVNAGIRMQGGNSLDMPKKSFRLFFRSRYGAERFNYPLFGPNSVSSFKNLVLKSGYDDDLTISTGTLLRDAISAELWQQTGGISNHSEWVALYLNDEFWGIYNIRESVNADYIKNKTGLEDFDMVRFDREGPILKHGTFESWDSLVNLTYSLDFSDTAAYYIMDSVLNMDNFIDLWAFANCAQYKSWAWGASAFTENNNEGWSWVIWDTDRAYDVPTWNEFNHGQDTTRLRWGNFLTLRFLQNDIFNKRVFNRMCDLLNTAFVPEHAIKVVDSLYNLIKPDINTEIERWNPQNQYWENNIQSIRDFLNYRPDILRNQILNWYSLDTTYTISLNIQGKGFIKLNTITIDDFPWQGIYIKDVPITITAIPKPGYKFVGWDGISSDSTTRELNLTTDNEITALFELDPSTSEFGIIINEICYQPMIENDSEDWIELYNSTPNEVDVSRFILKDNNSEHRYIFPSFTILGPYEYLVVAEDMEQFTSAFPSISNVIGSFGNGPYGFGLSSSSDALYLYNSSGVLIDEVMYCNGYPWPKIYNKTGGSIQLVDPYADNAFALNWNYSTYFPLTPGSQNLFHDTTTSIIIENIAFIDLHQNYPNPFRYYTNIPFSINRPREIEIKVVNTSMQLVKSLAKGYYDTGNYVITWDGTDHYGNKLTSGLYFYYIKTSDYLITRKVILLD